LRVFSVWFSPMNLGRSTCWAGPCASSRGSIS